MSPRAVASLLAGGAVLAVLVGIAWALLAWGNGREQEGYERARGEHREALLMAERARGNAQTAARATEALWATKLKEANHAREQDRQKATAALADVRADLDGLRGDATTYAAGGGDATGDTLAACHRRAANLAGAVGLALQAHERCTATAVSATDDVRALLHAWPVSRQPE
jgi:hypothetical protein